MVTQRYLIMFLGFYANALLYAHRANLSVAIVSMVKVNTSIHKQDEGGSCEIIPFNTTDSVVHKIKGTYEWSETLQGIVLGAQMYPNVIMPLIAGWLSDRFGAKWLTAMAVAGPGLLSTLIPLVAEVHVYLLIAHLIVIGTMNCCILSSMFSLFSNWFPAEEMPTAVGILSFGANFGLVSMFPIAGYLCEYVNWRSIFYLTGVLHLPWIICWLWIATDRPSESKTISQEELEYITSRCSASNSKEDKLPVPWSKILTSRPVWGAVCALFAEHFGYYLLLTKMPAYLDLVFGISIHQNGLLNSYVHLSTAVIQLLAGPLSVWLMKRDVISATNIRKMFESLGLFGPALSMVLIPYFGCNSTAIVILLIIAMTMYGFVIGGVWPITAEFAPDLAGTVFGFTLVLSVSTSFIVPIFAGLILDDDPGDKAKWNIIFGITVIIYLIGGSVFNMFASAKPQSWAVNKFDKEVIRQSNGKVGNRMDGQIEVKEERF